MFSAKFLEFFFCFMRGKEDLVGMSCLHSPPRPPPLFPFPSHTYQNDFFTHCIIIKISFLCVFLIGREALLSLTSCCSLSFLRLPFFVLFIVIIIFLNRSLYQKGHQSFLPFLHHIKASTVRPPYPSYLPLSLPKRAPPHKQLTQILH